MEEGIKGRHINSEQILEKEKSSKVKNGMCWKGMLEQMKLETILPWLLFQMQFLWEDKASDH